MKTFMSSVIKEIQRATMVPKIKIYHRLVYAQKGMKNYQCFQIKVIWERNCLREYKQPLKSMDKTLVNSKQWIFRYVPKFVRVSNKQLHKLSILKTTWQVTAWFYSCKYISNSFLDIYTKQGSTWKANSQKDIQN